jgi:hypothetical protein
MFEDQVTPSLFEGINARYYRAAEVARSFVPNEQFENLAVRQHSVIVGPRGSGKTTLLRMLHPECLRIWDHPRATTLRGKIDFSAAYVATDRVWRQQVEGAASGIGTTGTTDFFQEVVALDVMAAVLRTIEIRVTKGSGVAGDYRAVELGERALADLVGEMAEGWHLQPKFLNLGSLRVAIRRRRVEARDRLKGPKSSMTTETKPPVAHWEDAALLAIDAFESGTGLRDELWVLLFDELEIAPPQIRDDILSATRGMDPRLLLKCSLSPWLKEHMLSVSDYDATIFNDFNVLKLFYGRRTESYNFSRELIRGRLSIAGLVPDNRLPIEDVVFGTSNFSGDDGEGPQRRTAAAYGDKSPLGQVIRELADSDPNFRSWLDDHDISPDRLNKVNERKRSQTLRKARNIMIARLEFRRGSGLLRSRKTMAMYTGGATMLDICEGNPRLLLGLLLPLLEFFDGKHPIPRHLQAEALSQIADDFYALIDAIPVTPETRVTPEIGSRSLKSPYRELIERIADFFQRQTLRGDFNPQPPSTFRIPASASSALQLIVGRLINMGAVVIVPDRGIKDVIIGHFDQHRLRLCYLIAAREHLPPNIDRPVSVHRILGNQDEANSAMLPGLGSDE